MSLRGPGFEARAADWLEPDDAGRRILGACEPLSTESVLAADSLYRALATAEDRHRDTFLELAAAVAPDLWRARLDDLARAEAEIIARLPVRARIH